MSEQTMTAATTQTLEVPGAVLTYDVRRGGATDSTVLLMIGPPMGAAGSARPPGTSSTARS